MLNVTRKDRDYIWGRIYGELALWMRRANMPAVQRHACINDWILHPVSTFGEWMSRHLMSVIEAGASRGEEDARITAIMGGMDADVMCDDAKLGADAYLGYYHELAEYEHKEG